MIVSTLNVLLNAAMIFAGIGLLILNGNAYSAEDASVVTFYGYDDCLELRNSTTIVTLCPAAGGRVLRYAVNGKNVLYLPPGSEGWQFEPGVKKGKMYAGRFDFGPEKMVGQRDELWMGRWSAQITGDRSARMTSKIDARNGVQLIRDFELDRDSSYLRCTQTIHNVSDREVSYCHWSRTFAIGGGIAVVPRSERARFPSGYVLYEPGDKIQFKPDDPNVIVQDDAVIVSGPPEFPKLGFDSYEGWIAYYAPTDQLFVKRYASHRDRGYNEIAGLTASVWYPNDAMVEVEPIGPAENLSPGESANFDEHWWLLEAKFPEGDRVINFDELKQTVMRLRP
jgi:hypothetical protein